MFVARKAAELYTPTDIHHNTIFVITMVLNFRRSFMLAFCCAVPLLSVGAAQAQGIKLGTPASSEGQLDLGAAPAAAPAAAPSAQTATQPARPTGADVKRTNFKSWEVACLADNSNCAMAQIGKDSGGNPVLEMVIRKLPEPLEAGGEIAIAILDVITPLGVVLTEGLSLTIDNGESAIAPFQVCTEQGCLVREPIAEELINRLKQGSSAEVTVVAANQGVVSSKVSLSGFTAAFNALR